MVRLCVGLISAMVLVWLPAAARAVEPIGGPAHEAFVFDGDSLEFDGTVINLADIDAPELGQVCIHGDNAWACGLSAAFDLRKRLGLASGALRCWPRPETVDGALVATCLLGSEDLGRALLEGGHVVALPDAPPGYLAAEESARAAHLGLWSSTFDLPWEWRGAHVRGDPGKSSDVAACPVEAGTQDGRPLYQGPLDHDEDVRVHVRQPTELFCSDEAARAAGYRRSGERR